MSKTFDFPLLFQALADKTRLRLLNLIGEDEICVCFLVEALKTNQPKISRHLSYLRKAGIVAARRDGKWMHYRVVEPANHSAAKILADTRAWLTSDPEMQRDRKRLVGICCSPSSLVQLQGAPRPASMTRVSGGL
jgi:ArsR family transcriptional regulator